MPSLNDVDTLASLSLRPRTHGAALSVFPSTHCKAAEKAGEEFCHRHLQIPRYDRWAMPGGPAWLAGPPSEALVQAARVQLDFLVKTHELERIVLVTHFGCAWYSQKLKQPAEECLAEQFKDVERAAATLSGWYSGLAVEAYLAMRVNDWLSFHPIDLRDA